MESSETPKDGKIENKELQLKAIELARATREKGMGGLHGKFSPQIQDRLMAPPGKVGDQFSGLTSIGHFIQGESIPEADRSMLMIGGKTPYINNIDNYHYSPHVECPDNRQIWVASPYFPPMEVKRERKPIEKERKMLFGLKNKKVIEGDRTERIPTDIPITYHGKKGEPDWTLYEYYMIINYPYDTRPQIPVIMSIAVPPDLATQIDQQVKDDVYFPDAFFKALYPNTIGPDANKDITRKQATELNVVNLRGKSYYTRDNLRALYRHSAPYLREGEIRKYPQPIPY